MSEYQYYEFVALDRALTPDEVEELRRISTRAQISPTGFRNEYQWGDAFLSLNVSASASRTGVGSRVRSSSIGLEFSDSCPHLTSMTARHSIVCTASSLEASVRLLANIPLHFDVQPHREGPILWDRRVDRAGRVHV